MRYTLASIFAVISHAYAFLPFSTLDPVAHLNYTSIARIGTPQPDPHRWADISGPLPTNAFWTNIVLGPGDDRSNNIAALPYVLQPLHDALTIMYPYPFQSNDREYLNNFDDIEENIKLSAVQAQQGQINSYSVASFDSLSVTIQWKSASSSYMRAPVVRGNPYVTMYYNQLTPLVYSKMTLLAGTFKVDGQAANCSGNTQYYGSVFSFAFIQSDATWKVYSSSPISVICQCDAASFKLQSTATSWNGKWRLALVNNCTSGYNTNMCAARAQPWNMQNYESLVDKFAQNIVVGADLSFAKRSPSSKLGAGVTVSIQWKIESLVDGKDPSGTLMFGLPLHAEMINSNLPSTQILNRLNATHRSIRGSQVAIVADSWSLEYNLPEIDWYAPSSIDSDKVQDIVDALESEKDYNPPLNYQLGVGDPYNAGKMMAKMARMILIAEQLGKDDIKSSISKRLEQYMDVWLLHQSKNELIYDKSWRGIISCGCQYDDCGGKCIPRCLNNNAEPAAMTCPATTQSGYDFGNAFYNDHHFHYGYFIYSAAVLARVDPAWASSRNELVLSLIRDIANPSTDDEFFPVFRCTDIYESHSWALGIPLAGNQPFSNGKDQESTSEAVNAWYGIALYGKAIGDANMESVGLGLLALEIKGAQTFWQIKNDSKVYPDIYKKNYAFGIVWSHLTQYQTFFSNTGWAIHGIQQLPYTPISEALLDPTWVEQEFGFFQNACKADAQCDNDGWGSFVCMEQSIVDKLSGWKCAKSIPAKEYEAQSAGGNGNSMTNTLYFVATRPSANIVVTSEAGGRDI